MPKTEPQKPMPPVKPTPRRTAATIGAASATTTPLTVEASAEVPPPAPLTGSIAATVPSQPTVNGEEMTPEQAKEALKAMAADNEAFTVNPDGSITVPLEDPIDTTVFGIPGIVDKITLKRATWKLRRNAARRYPQNATPIDQDTCLIAELSGFPEHIIDEINSPDMSIIQMALGKLLFSPRLLSVT